MTALSNAKDKLTKYKSASIILKTTLFQILNVCVNYFFINDDQEIVRVAKCSRQIIKVNKTFKMLVHPQGIEPYSK